MLLGLTQLAGVPVKVSPHRSLNISRGVIRSRDIADSNVEEVVEELQPQRVTAASIIHVRDGDSRRRTNTRSTDVCISTSTKTHHSRLPEVPCRAIHSQPAALLQVPKIRPQLQSLQERCYICEMWEAGYEGISCSNHQKCANCKGEHSASSRDCPKWMLEKRVQQLKVERGISFPDARKAALSEQPTNAPRQTAASVVSTANSSVIQSKPSKLLPYLCKAN